MAIDFLEYSSDDNPEMKKCNGQCYGTIFRVRYPYSECYENAMNKVSDHNEWKMVIWNTYSYYDKDQLEGLSLEEARKNL